MALKHNAENFNIVTKNSLTILEDFFFFLKVVLTYQLPRKHNIALSDL